MDTAGVAVLILSTSLALLIVPDVRLAGLLEPTMQAAVGTPLILTAILLGRILGWRSRIERYLLAGFLLLMPTVYLLSLAMHGDARGWWTVELFGQVLFASVALAGLRFSGWLLVCGIVAHGLLWDFPHLGRTTFMPDWYALACMTVDVGWGLYGATRLAAWEADARHVTANPSPLGAVPVASR